MNQTIRNMPETFGNLEYKDVTNVHIIGLAALVILGIMMLLLPRKWAMIPILVIVCFIPSVQKIAILGLDFNFVRIMALLGFLRLWLRAEYIGFQWKSLDKAIIGWVLSSTVIYTLGHGSFSAMVNRLGFAFDAMGMYFLFRCLIRNWSDLGNMIQGAIVISIPVAIAFLLENRTRQNIFSVFGGVPAITIIRQGRLRCQGAFPHPIIAGCFWASLTPLFAAFWWKSLRDRLWAMTGLTAAVIIIICTASSTPIMGIMAAMLGGGMFYLRHYLKWIRWGTVFALLGLHLVMKAPVWHLISRVSAVGGSTGWHRYNLINQTINRFGEWWLLGTTSTAHWGWGLQDITNQYVVEAVTGGFLTLCLFVVLIVFAFRGVGYLWRSNQKNAYLLAVSWALGVCLFVHCVNFIGVSYFGQIYVVWYLLLAVIGSLMPVNLTVRRSGQNAFQVRRRLQERGAGNESATT